MIYQDVIPFNYLHHDVCHVLVSKYSENKSTVGAFVHKWSLTIYSVIHSRHTPAQVLGTGGSMTHSSDVIPVLMKLTLAIFGEAEAIQLTLEQGLNFSGPDFFQ